MSGVNFTDQEERRQYVENLGIEYAFSCEKERDPKACHLWGDWFAASKNDAKQSFNVYKLNCEQFKYPSSCNKVAIAMLTGVRDICPKDERGAVERLTTACDGGWPAACRLLAQMQIYGRGGLEPSSSVALETMEKACKLGDGAACWHASGWNYTGGPDESIPKDLARALELGKEGCEREIAQCCANISRMYRVGEGTEIDLKMAEKYKQDAQDLDNPV